MSGVCVISKEEIDIMKHKYKIIEYEPYYLQLDSLYELYDDDVKIWEGCCDSLEELLTNLGIEYEYEVIGWE